MWVNEFKDLNDLKQFLVNQINYDQASGFTFVGIPTKVDFNNIIDSLGKPENMNTESEQQQTLLYSAWVNHPTEGKRNHHKLTVLFWSFDHEPTEVIRIHFDYYKTAEFAAPFYDFIHELFVSIIEKLGKPEKKSMKEGNEKISYTKGKHLFAMWRNTEGLRIQIN